MLPLAPVLGGAGPFDFRRSIGGLEARSLFQRALEEGWARIQGRGTPRKSNLTIVMKQRQLSRGCTGPNGEEQVANQSRRDTGPEPS